MSAYICDKNHIVFLVLAAVSTTINDRYSPFRWYHDEQCHELRAGDFQRAAEVANMLWLENVRSVMHRYPNEKTSASSQGPVKGSFLVTERDFFSFMAKFEPVQVIKSIRCLDYQSCEHPGWRTSEARAFLDSLTLAAIRVLPGYGDAAWGYPENKPIGKSH